MNSDPEIIELESVDSTNTYLLQHPELWKCNFLSVTAKEQIRGRGRFGRFWHSGQGTDLTFSTLFLPQGPARTHACVGILAGLAVYRALKPLVPVPLALKWPNDILSEGRKLCGILCEYATRGMDNIIVIGIGMNVNATDFPPDLQHLAISLKKLTGMDHDTRYIMRLVIDRLRELLMPFRASLDADTVDEWVRASDSIGRSIRYCTDSHERRGTISGILTDGALLVHDAETGEPVAWYGEIEYE